MRALQALLTRLIDYAGLFPPAGLDMAAAAGNYDSYRASRESWMLGRFVVPASRLDGLAAAMAGLRPNGRASDWPVSALLGADRTGDLRHVAAHAERGRLLVDSIELRVQHADDVSAAAGEIVGATRAMRTPPLVFVELPSGADPAPFADAARGAGVALKLRTGGVTADAFPSAEAVVQFLAACVAGGVACKLTAGLHHPLPGEHPLTYDAGCARGAMFGFLNVFATAALLRAGHDADRVAPLLAERDAAALTFDDDGVSWRGLCAGLTELAPGTRAVVSFGSCSFEEPVADLRALGLLPPSPAAAGANAFAYST